MNKPTLFKSSTCTGYYELVKLVGESKLFQFFNVIDVETVQGAEAAAEYRIGSLPTIISGTGFRYIGTYDCLNFVRPQ